MKPLLLICSKQSKSWAPEKVSAYKADGGVGALKVVIDVPEVDGAIGELLKKTDLSRFVL